MTVELIYIINKKNWMSHILIIQMKQIKYL